MINLTYRDETISADIPPAIPAITDEARRLADWPDGVPIEARQTSDDAWAVTCQGETVTAETV